ncbi:HNH endonuclease [Streptomyces sp. NPDC087903]|uniref:HNH endonuclease n=1 Tax=Streptomyces sp. NPDC087903 TaxID=3365819 RepID=UPI0038006285
MAKDSRDPIPENIKREVRQRCGFGCVVCGLPLYEYDHMTPHAQVLVHEADNLTLLCDRHHREKTDGLLPLDLVRRKNEKPANIEMGISTPYGLHFYGEECEIQVSDIRFFGHRSKLVPFLINEEEFVSFSFDGDRILLNMLIRGKNGETALSVVENEIVYSASSWDIEFFGGSGKTLKMRNALRDIQFAVTFHPPSRIHVSRLKMAYGEVKVYVDDAGFHVRGPGARRRDMRNMSGSGFQYGIILDSPSFRGTAMGFI